MYIVYKCFSSKIQLHIINWHQLTSTSQLLPTDTSTFKTMGPTGKKKITAFGAFRKKDVIGCLWIDLVSVHTHQWQIKGLNITILGFLNVTYIWHPMKEIVFWSHLGAWLTWTSQIVRCNLQFAWSKIPVNYLSVYHAYGTELTW